mgnify:CR=1 FL=1
MATIRDIRPDDRSRLRRIQESVLSDPSPDVLAAALDGPLFGLVAVESGVAVGYLLAIGGERRVYVPELAVAESAQREGHGSRLVSTASTRFRNRDFETMRLTARADDEAARHFYEQLGFAMVERLPDNYDNADGIVYEKRLDE